jgi:hypothetical protein
MNYSLTTRARFFQRNNSDKYVESVNPTSWPTAYNGIYYVNIQDQRLH